jgi:hypothetical protein
MAREEITQERLREMLDYDPAFGVFTWKISPGPRTMAGTKAGKVGPKNTTVIQIDGKYHYAHRLAWLYVNGSLPDGYVIAENGDFTDTRLDNLVEKSRGEIQRTGKLRSTNTSGARGVTWDPQTQKWKATICRNYRRIYLGLFVTKEEAAAAYEAATRSEHPADIGTLMPFKPMETRRSRLASYNTIRRDPKLVGWDTIEEFLADMGEPPTAEHVLMRVRHSLPLGPGNAQWRLPWKTLHGGNEAVKRTHHLGRYGLNDEDFRRMLAAQGGVCMLCRRPERQSFNGTAKQLSVDHDEVTKKVRDLLCMSCNTAIGSADENPWLLRTMADYLEWWKADHTSTDNVVSLIPKDLA